MKRRTYRSVAFILLFACCQLTHAQYPPHPNDGANPGNSGGPVGGGAPLESGVSFLVLLAAGYASRKIYRMRKHLLE